MKQHNALITIALLIAGVFAVTWVTDDFDRFSFAATTPQQTAIELPIAKVDLGQVKADVPVAIAIPFRNTGSNALIVAEVATSCGCTQARWPQYPVLPGTSDTIRVSYDAKHIGRFSKTITILGNFTQAEAIVTGEVIECKPK